MKKVNKKRFEADKMAKAVCRNEPELLFLEKKNSSFYVPRFTHRIKTDPFQMELFRMLSIK